MLDWMKKSRPCAGDVLFRGNIPPRPEEFAFLSEAGIQVSPIKVTKSVHWSLKLVHPQWGDATLTALRDHHPPRILIDFAAGLTDEERDEASAFRCAVTFQMKTTRDHVLRDRKNALRFMRAVMGDDGLAAIDYVAQAVWPRAALDEELSHGADLDVESILGLHGIRGNNEDDPVTWLHTHGLGEIGFFDFDIIRPDPDLFDRASDCLRAIAFTILEGTTSPSTPRLRIAEPGGDIRFVPATEFDQLAAPQYSALRADEDGTHQERRAVICQPVRGFWSRWSRKVRPSRFLSGPLGDQVVFFLSPEATELGADRARKTYGALRRLAEEFSEFDFPVLVKLGYETDRGGGSREHLWFTVDRFYEDTIEATLSSQPFDIAGMNEGDRGRHPVERLSDWLILTPAGFVNPRHSMPVRRLRPRLDELRKIPELRRSPMG